MTILFLLFHGIFFLLNLVFRLFDEVIFYRYRFVEINNPVFIISSPRSGTTYLHRLLCLDDEKFTYMRLYHTIISSVSFYKMVWVVSKMDRLIGNPLKRMIRCLEKFIFKGWEGIHNLSLNRSEEDEGLWFFAWCSPAISLVTPFYGEFRYLSKLDEYPDSEKNKLMRFYRNALKRMYFHFGNNKIFLIKSVMASGRLRSYLDSFPGARIIFINRDPLKTIPSYISMFSKSWKLHSPDATSDQLLHKDLSTAPIDFYTHFKKIRKLIPDKQIIEIEYDQLIAEPVKTIREIYQYWGFEWKKPFEEKLYRELTKAIPYRSKHSYTLEEFGLDKDELLQILENSNEPDLKM